jgi:hypothetical protein
MLTLEKRPTSPARLASIALGAVFAAVVGILFIAPMIAGYQAAVLSPGDSASFSACCRPAQPHGFPVARLYAFASLSRPVARVIFATVSPRPRDFAGTP